MAKSKLLWQVLAVLGIAGGVALAASSLNLFDLFGWFGEFGKWVQLAAGVAIVWFIGKQFKR